MRLAPAFALGVLTGILAGCTGGEAEPDTGWTPRERALLLGMALPAAPPASPGNAVADSPAAATLGVRLFTDPGLSANGQVSCATCHEADKAMTDGKPMASAIGSTRRNTPTLLGAAWQRWLFWDGRADSLWSQAVGPLTAPAEHGATPELVRQRVLDVHRPEFEAVFGPVSDDPERVLAQVGKAIEAHERTLTPGRSRFDAYVTELASGAKPSSLSPEELRGLQVFVRKGECVACHNGPMLSDGEFHNLGIDPVVPPTGIDAGRQRGLEQVLTSPFRCDGPHSDAVFEVGQPDPCAELHFVDPAFPDAVGAFRTPTLRNVARTAPYMHAGQLATLDDVLDFYDDLPGRPFVGHRELTLRPRKFTDEERAALLAFLHTLDGAPAAP